MNKRPAGKLFIIEGEIDIVKDGDKEIWTVDGESLAVAVARQLGWLWRRGKLYLGETRLWLERIE